MATAHVGMPFNLLYTGQKTHLNMITCGFRVQCKCVQTGFTSGSIDHAVVMGIYGLWKGLAVG